MTSFLSGVADTDLTKFQWVQNWLTPVVTKSPRSHLAVITRGVPLLYSLHRLPIKCRFDLVICFLVYKTPPENDLFILTQCFLHHSHSIHSNHTRESFCQSLWSRPMKAHEYFTFALLFFGTAFRCPFTYFSCNLQDAFEDTSLWLGLPLIDTSMPDECWCYGTASLILLLNTDLAVVPMSLAKLGSIGPLEIN